MTDMTDVLKPCFDRNECLLKVADEIKNPFVLSKVDDVPKSVLCFLFAQLRNLYESTIILLRRGFPQQAYILLRSLQEGYINICWILAEEDEIVRRASSWIAYDVIERKRMLHHIKRGRELDTAIKAEWLRKEKKLLEDYEQFKDTANMWPKTVLNRCEEAKLAGEYPLYCHSSSKAHLSPRMTLDQVKFNGQTWKYKIGAALDKQDILRPLVSSHRYFLLALVYLCQFFGVKPDKKLRWHARIWTDHLPRDVKLFLG